MAFKDIWRPRIDGVNNADSSAVNEIAEAVIDNENAIKKNATAILGKQDKLSKEQLENIDKVPDKQEALTEEQLQNIQDVPNKADADYVNKTFTNILKGSAIGQSVNLTDVSPIEHNLDVKVKSKNISVVTRYANATGTNNLLVECVTIPMEVGKVYTASWDTKVSDVRCWFTLYQSYREFISQSQNMNSCDGTRKYYTFKIISKPGGLGGWALRQSNSAIAEECPISNFMLEEGEVATEYTPYMADVSGVSVKKYGKNLLDINNIAKLVNANAVVEGNSLLITKTNTTNAFSNVYYTFGDLSQYVGKTLTLNCKNESSYAWIAYIGGYSDGWVSPPSLIGKQIDGNTETSFTFTVPEIDDASELCLRIQSGNNSIATNETYKLSNIQVEIGEVSTEYEPYKEPTTYNVNADGTVEGVTSVYPTTTLLTDTGAVVDVTYNRDINKAFAELEEKLTQAIVSLGNNI